MDFRITGISPEPFRPLFGLDDEALAERGIIRSIADGAQPGYPCRVSLEHADPGDELLLTSFEHQPVKSPYRAAGPIFVRKQALSMFDKINVVPAPVRMRLLSWRGYDANDLIVEAEIGEGRDFEEMLVRFFKRDDVAYLHLHYARRGCYACRVDRV